MLSSLSQQILAVLVASLFRLLLLHCIAFFCRALCDPGPSLLLPPGAKHHSYATDVARSLCDI